MNDISQVRYGSLAHLLLMRDGRHDELAGLLLDNSEGRNLGLLSVGLAVDTVSA